MELIAGGGISILCSLLLWLFLPRGVVLTKEGPFQDDPTYASLPQWQVKNESALSVRILMAGVRGVDTYNEATQKFDEVDVTDDEQHLMLHAEGDPEVRGYILHPGETFSAHVDTNTTLTIRYRRAGWSGVLERRHLLIDGGV